MWSGPVWTPLCCALHLLTTSPNFPHIMQISTSDSQRTMCHAAAKTFLRRFFSFNKPRLGRSLVCVRCVECECSWDWLLLLQQPAVQGDSVSSYCYSSLQYNENQSHPTVRAGCSTTRLSLTILLQQPAVQRDTFSPYCYSSLQYKETVLLYCGLQ